MLIIRYSKNMSTELKQVGLYRLESLIHSGSLDLYRYHFINVEQSCHLVLASCWYKEEWHKN